MPTHIRFAMAACCCMGVLAAIIVPFENAWADVVISSATTQNMTCSGGVCAPTSTNAVLNVSDLENFLASGNLEVTTTGSGVQADNIDVKAALTWTNGNTLAFDAYDSITIDKPVTVSGPGGLSVTTNDGGSGGIFAFSAKGHVTFANLSSQLTINGAPYALESNITTLAAAIAANSAGDYALANDYDASGDGTYQNSPIPTEFSGAFEGLGNTISNLSITGTGNASAYVGLFAELASNGQVENIVLRKVNVGGSGFTAGALVGLNTGTINGAFASGSASSGYDHTGPEIGMLVGGNYGTIARSGASGSVTSAEPAGAGGLAGGNAGSITQSYADCKVSGGESSSVGGLVGGSVGPIVQSYAIGKATGGTGSYIGGLVGENSEESTIAQAYSTAAVKHSHDYPSGTLLGGLIGIDYSPAGSNTSTYWDTQTSNISNPGQGAGHPRNDPGITGLTTEQFQSGLPSGFDPTIWAEKTSINNGFPYLIANPPRK